MSMKKFFEHWDEVQDITLKVINQIPEDKLDFKPVPEVFSIKELVLHIFDCEKAFVEGAVQGELKMEQFVAPDHSGFKTVKDLHDYAKAVHEELDAKIASKSDEELMQIVKTPWGDMPVFVHMNGAYEHMWHHRGQLYTYLRLVGVKPVFVFAYPGIPVIEA